MWFKIGILALPLLIASSTSDAQEFEKNGLPCVAEICLGDGIQDLSKVQWDRAKNPFSSPQKPLYTATQKVTESDRKAIASNFRGKLDKATSFLYYRLFDSVALPALTQVTAACIKNELIGTYTTKSGNPTRVGIALTPSKDDVSNQQWTVVSIVRTFPKAISDEQKSEVEAELNKRYYAFGANNREIKNPKPGEGRYSRAFGSFGFVLLLFRGTEEADRLTLHPACGGASKVMVD